MQLLKDLKSKLKLSQDVEVQSIFKEIEKAMANKEKKTSDNKSSRLGKEVNALIL
jgi:hypothetical protein